ncbi:hypothetical protein FACS1894137_14950 [Spirochaetia bacterium]|nr:hypothetical protein FACS1894137_14950 [Spirochaetia bacterium]
MFLGTIDINEIIRFDAGSVFKRAIIMGMAVPTTPPSPKGYHNWMPGSRAEQLALALKWITILALMGSLWNVPVTVRDKLEALHLSAAAALAITTDPNGCTHSDTVACEVAFANLREHMMLLKNRYLLVPPLSEAEAAELGVSKNTSRIDVPEPLGILHIVVEHTGPSQVRLLVTHLPGSPVDRDGVADSREIHYELVDPNGTVFSIDPEEFNHTIIDKNKYITLMLPPGSIGRRLRTSGRYLNAHGGHGQWRPIVEAMVS